jgi:hypothetical protein
MPMRRALVVIACALMACGGAPTQTPPSDSLMLVRHAPSPARPLALAQGEVVVRNRCLYLQNTLLIWPNDYGLGGDFLSVVGGGFVVRPGDFIKVGGGGYTDLANLPSPVDGGPPPCSGPYFWISETISVQ